MLTFAPKTLASSLILPNSSSFLSQFNLPSFMCPCFSTSSKNENQTHLLMRKYSFSHQGPKHVSSASLSRFTDPQTSADSLLTFLKEKDFLDAQLERVLTYWPRFLSASLENDIQPKLKIFQDFGLSDSEIAEIISKDPYILKYVGASKIIAALSIFKSLLGTDERLAMLLRSHTGLFYSDLEETMLPNIEFLKTCGIPMVQITDQLYINPNFLMNKPERLRSSVHMVDEMGFERDSEMFIDAVKAVASISDETWELMRERSQDLGFSFLFAVSTPEMKKGKGREFTRRVEKRVKPRLQVFKVLEKKNLEKQLSLSSLSTWAVYHRLMRKHHFSPEAATKVSSDLSHFTNPAKVDSMLTFLKEIGFSNSQLERFMTIWPRFLSASLENNIQPKLKILQDFGFSASDIVEMLSNDPSILKFSESKITASLSIFKSLLGTNDGVAKLLTTRTMLFYTDLEETLLPNIEFLKSCGIPMERIINKLYMSPNFLMIKPESMMNSVRKVDEMGLERTSKMFLYALQVVGSFRDENWQLKLKTFKELGFSEDDITRMLRISPSVFTLSEQKIQKVIEVLLESGKYDMSSIINYPMSLGYSAEKRYKPRLQVLKLLEKRNLIDKWPSLAALGYKSDKRFIEKYVEPYMKEVGETIMAKNAVSCETCT